MKEMAGWIKLHRQSLQSVVWDNSNTWKVWTWCLLRANHKKITVRFHGEEIVLLPGQFISGRYAGAEECNLIPSTFRDQVTFLRKIGNLDTSSDNKKTIFTIIKWGKYQPLDKLPDSTSDNSSTTTRQRPDTDKNVKNERISTGEPPFYTCSYFTVSIAEKEQFQKTWQLTNETLKREFAKMEAWIKDNGRAIKNYHSFITRWLGKLPPKETTQHINKIQRVLTPEEQAKKAWREERGL